MRLIRKQEFENVHQNKDFKKKKKKKVFVYLK